MMTPHSLNMRYIPCFNTKVGFHGEGFRFVESVPLVDFSLPQRQYLKPLEGIGPTTEYLSVPNWNGMHEGNPLTPINAFFSRGIR